MTVNISKPAINVADKLAEQNLPVGQAGHAMLQADTPQQQQTLVNLGRKNFAYNGEFHVWQRGTSFTSVGTNNTYTADRWAYQEGTATPAFTVSRQSGPTFAGFDRSLKLEVTTADTGTSANKYVQLSQALEGLDLQGLGKGTRGAKSCTLSFWVKSNFVGTYAAILWDAPNSRQNSASYAIEQSGVWERKVITFVGDETGAIDADESEGLSIKFVLAAGSNYTGGAEGPSAHSTSSNYAAKQDVDLVTIVGNYWQIAGVQLEIGTTDTPYEHLRYGEELALCQRYYYKITGGTTEVLGIGGNCESTTSAFGSTFFPVEMRATPTAIEQSGDATDYRIFHSATTTLCSSVPTFNGATTNRIGVTDFTVASGLTAHRPAQVGSANSDGYLAWSAEL